MRHNPRIRRSLDSVRGAFFFLLSMFSKERDSKKHFSLELEQVMHVSFGEHRSETSPSVASNFLSSNSSLERGFQSRERPEMLLILIKEEKKKTMMSCLRV